MLIGDKNTFAVECYHEPVANTGRQVYGRMCIWAGGHRLGDIDEPVCVLGATAGHLRAVLARIDSLDDPGLRGLSDRDAFAFLNHAIYLDDERSDDQVAADARRFSKFDFLTNAGESFDHTKSFVVAHDDRLRVLFEDDWNGFASANIARSTFTVVVEDFLRWIADEGEKAG